jgi:hypothetical protein
MTRTSTKTEKPTLHPETLRTLTPGELRLVAGGQEMEHGRRLR